MAAVIMWLVVVHKASKNRVVKATDTMSPTAGKTHSAHLPPEQIVRRQLNDRVGMQGNC